MNILVVGGTRFFGVPMIKELLENGHNVTIATRGLTQDNFGNNVHRIIVRDIYNEQYAREALEGLVFDVVIDKMGYGAGDIKNIMDNVKCKRFVHMSTAGVYQLDHMGVRENEFDATQGEIVWCHRGEVPYDDAKRSAERALAQEYRDIKKISVRYPYVIGENDYTKRLAFYVSHILEEKEMYIDNVEEQLCFIDEETAGILMARLATLDDDALDDLIATEGVADGCFLAVNGCLDGTISIAEILHYVEEKTGKKAIVCEKRSGAVEEGPYNRTVGNSLDTSIARNVMGEFSDVKEIVREILDFDIENN